ncbi:hypothetical protein D3C73_1632940 [compost metagenome]
MIRVDSAIILSDRIINSLRLYRSAQTPANGDSRKVGTKPHTIEMVIMIPDWVVSVICHIIAY